MTPSVAVPADPQFQSRIRESFERQTLMRSLGATLVRVEPGLVHIGMDYSESYTQQHGFLHAGALAAIADSACGYAAATLMPAGSDVLSVEFKLNLLAPAAGERFVARGQVVCSGRTLTVCSAEVVAYTKGGEERLIAIMQATMIRR